MMVRGIPWAHDEVPTLPLLACWCAAQSPKPRPGRGRGRGRDVSTGGAGGSRTTTTRSHDVHSGHTGGVGRAAAEAQDALESPLHILGEVAEMTRGPDDGPSATHVSDDVVLPLSIGGNKRKRRPSNVQVCWDLAPWARCMASMLP